MKIGIPVQDDRASEARVSPHFGRAPYFALVDVGTGEVTMVPNDHTCDEHSRYGAARRVEALGVDTVVCRSLGRRALASLEAIGIDVYASDQPTVDRVVGELRTRRVARFPVERACAGGHHHGEHGRGRRHKMEEEK